MVIQKITGARKATVLPGQVALAPNGSASRITLRTHKLIRDISLKRLMQNLLEPIPMKMQPPASVGIEVMQRVLQDGQELTSYDSILAKLQREPELSKIVSELFADPVRIARLAPVKTEPHTD